MSISNPSIENPCKKWISFKGDKGNFVYWDKEKEENIEIKLPIFFIVLDELATITGFSKKHDCGIYSNEVHRTADELLRVKTFSGGEEITGLYSDIKDSIVAMGGKYTKSVYALLINPNKSTELVNFKFKGASFSGWLEKKFNVDRSAVGIMSLKEDINGSIKYQIPVFQKFKMTEEYRERAIAADVILQAYLEEYFKTAPQKSTETYLPESIAAKAGMSNPLIDDNNFVPRGGFKDPEGNQGSPGMASKDHYASFVPDEKEVPDFPEPGNDELSDLPF
jgi:hypothetical protein